PAASRRRAGGGSRSAPRAPAASCCVSAPAALCCVSAPAASEAPRAPRPGGRPRPDAVEPPTPKLRRAEPSQVPALAQVLARAFLDDPVARWACAPERLRPRVLERFHATRMRHMLDHEE